GSNVDGSKGVLLYLGNLSGSGAQDATLIIESSDMTHGLPAGYSELKTQSLPEPTVQGVDVFQTLLYSGDNTNNRDITGAGFRPDFLWLKLRNGTLSHKLIESSRGVTKVLYSDSNGVEGTEAGLDSFQSDGIRVDNANDTNGTGNNYVAWLWKANNGTTASNGNGSTSTTVQVAPEGHMSIATLTAPGGATTFGHGLSGAPELVTIKRRDSGDSWYSWMTGMGSVDYMTLDSNAASSSNSAVYTALPTSTVVNGGTIFGAGDYSMYCFRSVTGVCHLGTYIGNGSTDGPIVNVGFRPRWILVKNIGGAGGWVCFDTARDTAQPLDQYLDMSENHAEVTSGLDIDVLAQGFKIRIGHSWLNNAGVKYGYMTMVDVISGFNLPPIPGK
ncbi:MAG: hypothetical protein CL885_00990, partial [Dehalococcoidia bacterium]|nr:hypothetical protein [Dehalococcoidia bacterium]